MRCQQYFSHGVKFSHKQFIWTHLDESKCMRILKDPKATDHSIINSIVRN